MQRNAICYLTLAILLAACAPVATSFPVEVDSPTASLTAIPKLISPSATAVPQLTVTVTPFCEPLQKTSLKIMPLGDSITYGEGIPGYGGYRNLLGALLESDGYIIDFVGSQQSAEEVLPDADNEGHPGWTISNIKRGIDSEGWLETYQPDIILLHIGSNDLLGSDDSPYGNTAYAPDDLSALLDDILARLPGTHIIVAQIISTRWGANANHRFYNDAIPDIIASKGPRVSVVDMRNILSKSDFATLYHPSPKGYDKMAHAWESAILVLELVAGCVTSR
jgi:lysophospholipase L1-like esterase